MLLWNRRRRSSARPAQPRRTPVTPTRTPARIAVIGAGPGGLICARILQRHGIDVTVYELDASATARDQGGTLDMHPDTGGHAPARRRLVGRLRRLGPPRGRTVAPGRARRADDVRRGSAPRRPGSPEIDRGQLRDLLLGSLAPGPSGGATSWTTSNRSATAATACTSPMSTPPTPTWSSERTAPGRECARWCPTPCPSTPESPSSKPA